MQSAQPPEPSAPPPPSSPPSPGVFAGSVDLRVGRHLLWVGNAAYPLRNITRVHTFTMKPRRQDATMRFVTRAAITAAAVIALSLLGTLPAVLGSVVGRSNAGWAGILFVWLIGFGLGAYFFVDLVVVLAAPAHFVLAVETSGLSTALVTSRNPHHLLQLVGYIVHAIENPETEFQVTVETLSINPRNYYFGDNVNMYGGSGNVGVAA